MPAHLMDVCRHGRLGQCDDCDQRAQAMASDHHEPCTVCLGARGLEITVACPACGGSGTETAAPDWPQVYAELCDLTNRAARLRYLVAQVLPEPAPAGEEGG